MNSAIEKVSQADAEVERLKAALDDARHAQQTAHKEALQVICPFARLSPDERFIPINATQAIIRPRLSMRKPHTSRGVPIWEATGKQVRFRLGVMEGVREGSIDQPAYEALPENIRSLTREMMIENTKKQELTGAGKPLKLSERQIAMFMGLASAQEKTTFNPRGAEGGQRLPSGIWDSESATLQIWRTMLKRGVLTLESGNPERSYSSWRVNPGPRFEEAVDLALEKSDLSRGSVGYQNFQKAFRPAKAESSARSPRP